MRLLDKIKSALASSDGAITPPVATFATRPDTVYAPVSGMVVTLDEVNDEVVSGGLLGDGVGIIPTGLPVLYAPVNGRVGATTVTNHAIALSTEDGIEVLIHIGLGTVDMNGRGFTRLVEANDEVKAGQPLMTFDPDAIKLAGCDDVVVVVVSNPEAFERVSHVVDSGTLLGGHPLAKLGDPLLVVKR